MSAPTMLATLLVMTAMSADAMPFDAIPVAGWRWTTERPAEAWQGPDFDASAWREGVPGFGNQGLPPVQQALVKTPWTTPDLWVRAEFDLEAVSETPALRLSHDEDVEVYLNGVLVCERKGYITDYAIHALRAEARDALRVGRNTLAAHCRQTVGGQFLDVQLIHYAAAPRRTVEDIIAELGPTPRPEHPRPDRVRADWANLNGVWELAFDPHGLGLKEGWNDGRRLEREIVVPFCPESVYSGVHDEDYHPQCWYARSFDLPDSVRGRRVLLHFGAVDYRADVWLNGEHLGKHEGGYDPFDFDVTALLKPTGNRVVVRAHDDPFEAKPRGKQSPDRYPQGCAYMRVTGIWQTVWLEAVGQSYLRDWVATPDADSGTVAIKAAVDGPAMGTKLTAILSRDGTEVTRGVGDPGDMAVTAPQPALWSPERPVLYDLDLVLADAVGKELDRVRTYVGFRKIGIAEGMYRLNDKPFFLISALDQGYWPESLYTPVTDKAQRADVEWAKRYGLNSIRKHQIVPEPRFLYWCDRLGLTVWGEMADWGMGVQPPEPFLRQWLACLRRDRNHPCIITWVPTNEHKSPNDDGEIAGRLAVVKATREADPTRPVVDTSGYCHTETDICDLHVNPPDGAACVKWWQSWRESIAATGNFMCYPETPAYCKGFRHQGQPVVFSETGNWRITELPPMGIWAPYGYGPVPTVAAFVDLYRDFFVGLMSEPECAGFSYVQLYDVEGEVNGYLTYDRKPKVAPEVISAIHEEGLRRRGAKGDRRNTVRPGNCSQDSGGTDGREAGHPSEAWDCRIGRRGREFGSAGDKSDFHE